MLDVSRIVSGKLRLDLRSVDPGAVIRSAVDTVLPAAQAKGISLQTVMDPGRRPHHGRPRPAAADRLEPALERDQVHAARRARADPAGAAELPRRDHGRGQRARHRRRLPPLRLRPLPPGGRVEHAAPRRARAGSRHRATPDRAARRHRPRGEPRRGERRRVHDPAPATRGRGECGQRRRSATRPTTRAPTTLAISLDRRDRAGDRRPAGRARPRVGGAGAARSARLHRAVRRRRARGADARAAGRRAGGRRDAGRERARLHPPGARPRRPARAEGRPAAALTAYASSTDRTHALLAGFDMHVPKPVQPVELAAVVARLSGRGA